MKVAVIVVALFDFPISCPRLQATADADYCIADWDTDIVSLKQPILWVGEY